VYPDKVAVAPFSQTLRLLPMPFLNVHYLLQVQSEKRCSTCQTDRVSQVTVAPDPHTSPTINLLQNEKKRQESNEFWIVKINPTRFSCAITHVYMHTNQKVNNERRVLKQKTLVNTKIREKFGVDFYSGFSESV
jgi:hypothetical protein